MEEGLRGGIEEYINRPEHTGGMESFKISQYSDEAQDIIHKSPEWQEAKSGMINDRNESQAINEMIEKGIISPEYAETFDFNEEIQIPPTFLKEAPMLSKELRNYVVSKFTPEDFKPEKAYGRSIHGTSFSALYPIWMGKGRLRTGEYGVHQSPYMYGSHRKQAVEAYPASETKGRFGIIGDNTFIREFGFGPNPETGKRELSESHFPINIIGPYYNRDKNGLRDGYAWATDPKAIVLAKWDELSVDTIIKELEKYKTDPSPSTKIRYIPGWVFKDIVVKAQDIFNDPYKREEYIENILNRLKLTPEEEDVLNRQYDDWERSIKDRVEYKKRYGDNFIKSLNDLESDNQGLSQQAKYEIISEIFRVLYSTMTEEERAGYVHSHIEYLKNLQARNEGKELFDWSKERSDYERIFTVEQMANYIANVMVRGVDKSKILPIYDWDGNLLWPLDPEEKQITE